MLMYRVREIRYLGVKTKRNIKKIENVEDE